MKSDEIGPPDADPAEAPGQTPFIGHRKETLHGPPGMHSFIEDGINLNTNLECES